MSWKLDMKNSDFTVIIRVSSTLQKMSSITRGQHPEEISLPLRESRREGARSNEGSHSRKWIRHANKGVVCRKAECVPTEGRIGEIRHSGVKGEFVRKQAPLEWEESGVELMRDSVEAETETGIVNIANSVDCNCK